MYIYVSEFCTCSGPQVSSHLTEITIISAFHKIRTPSSSFSSSSFLFSTCRSSSSRYPSHCSTLLLLLFSLLLLSLSVFLLVLFSSPPSSPRHSLSVVFSEHWRLKRVASGGHTIGTDIWSIEHIKHGYASICSFQK